MAASTAHLFVSTNLGANWSSNALPWTPLNSVSGAASAHASTILLTGPTNAASSTGPIYLSHDMGSTWLLTDAPSQEWTPALSADGNFMAAAALAQTSVTPGIWTATVTPSPILTLNSSPSNLLLSWLVPSASFSLQTCSNLTAPTWIPITSAPTLNPTNLHEEISVPTPSAGSPNAFFRLASP